MPVTANDLHGVLDGYRRFLREKDLAPAGHQPYLVRWVREFLLYAETHRGYSFEQTVWQRRCARGAVKVIHHYGNEDLKVYQVQGRVLRQVGRSSTAQVSALESQATEWRALRDVGSCCQLLRRRNTCCTCLRASARRSTSSRVL